MICHLKSNKMDYVIDYMDNFMEIKRKEGFEGQQLYRLPLQVLRRVRSKPFTRDFIVTDLGYFPESRGHLVERPQGIDQTVLMFIEKGCGWVQLNEKMHHLGAGHMVILPAGVPHRYGASETEPWRLFWFHFEGRGALDLLQWTEFSIENPIANCSAPETFRRLFRSIFAAVERGYQEHTLLQLSNVLINILTLLHRNPLQDRSRSEAIACIERVMDEMREDVTQPQTLEDYARSAGYSVPQFSIWFKAHTGVSPMTYFSELRMQRACELLDTTSLSIKQVALELGYADPLYFTRCFTKCTGKSPKSYRSSL